MERCCNCDIKKDLNKKFTVCESIDLSKYCICTDSITETTICLGNLDYKIIKCKQEFNLLAKGALIIKIRYCDNCCGKLYCKCFVIPFMKLVKLPPCSKVLKCSTNLIYYDICKCGKDNLLIYTVSSLSLLISKCCSTPQMCNCCNDDCPQCPPICCNTFNNKCTDDCTTIDFKNDSFPENNYC